MEYNPYRRHTPRENGMTQMRFNNSPSTTIGGSEVTRKGMGAASPLSPQEPNSARPGSASGYKGSSVRSLADLGDEPRPQTSNKYHNCESEIPLSDWPKVGVRRVDPVTHKEPQHGLGMVRNAKVNANERHLNIVGSQGIHVNDKKNLDRPLSGIRCRAQSHRDAGWMNRQFGEQDRTHTTTSQELAAGVNSEGHIENPEVRFRMEHVSGWDHSVTKLQRVRITVCDHVMHKAGGVSGFYCALVRGQVGANPVTPRVSSDPTHYNGRNDRHLTIELLRDQLESLTGEEIEIYELAFLLYNVQKGDESYPATVTYRVFTDAFAKVPDQLKLVSHKI